MSGVAGIFNVPDTAEELSVWATTHARHHVDINRRLFEILGTNFVEYVLDPINPNDTDVWSYQHQQMHTDMDAVLGIAGFDLTEVNFKDRELLTGWIQLHGNEHYLAANTLGIG